MRFVDRNGPNQVGLNWMWLPTWIGMNQPLTRELDTFLSQHFVGRELTDDTLESAHDALVEYLTQRFPHIEGLFDYLDSIKYVTNGEPQQPEEKGGSSPSPAG